MGLTRRTVQGALWTYGSFAAGRLLVFASTAILARLLAPDDFGLMGLALLTMNFLELTSGLGVRGALIYYQDDRERAADAAFLINLAVGVAQFALAYLIAPWVSLFFRNPQVTPILRILALNFVIVAGGGVHDALLYKELAFRERFIPDFARGLMKGTFSVLFALMGRGVWSLVAGQIAGSLTYTVLLWRAMPWRPSWTFYRPVVRRLLGYGLHLIAIDSLSVVVDNAGYLIIGRFLGSAALGFYTLALRVPELAILNLCMVLTRVTFPAYVKLGQDRQALLRGFLATLRYTALVTVPAGVGLALVASDFVVVVYSARWSPAIPALQALALYATFRSLSWSSGDVYKATGRPGILTWLMVVELVSLAPALWFGTPYGVAGVAVAMAAAALSNTVLRLSIAIRVLDTGPGPLMTALAPALTGTALMSMGLVAWRYALPTLPPLADLAGSVLLGGGLYAAYLWWGSRSTVLGAVQVIRLTLGKAS